MKQNYQKLINKIVHKIVEGVHPNKVVLFGSIAQDQQKKDSDLDFFIVMPSNLRRDLRDIEIRKLLSDIVFPLDIFVYTPQEVKTYEKLTGSFIKKVMETGKVLYECK